MRISDFALSGLPQDLRDFLRREEAAHHFDAHRMIAKAMAKGLQVLLRQNGRRRQHGDLLAAFDGEERRPHGDFGLAVADIAANQSVHRLLALHAGEGFVDGALLVGVSSYSNPASNSLYKLSGEAKPVPARASRRA